MKILLPPSETKRPGGDGVALNLDNLALPSLRAQRRAVVDALVSLSADTDIARKVLKLSANQVGDIDFNRALLSAPTMPAVDRYTGVLFDALDAPTLSAVSRRWLGSHVWIHSAPFGPVSALDPIPAYRLAAGTSLPGVAPLRRHWAEPTAAAFVAEAPSFVLDLRSEAYVALGPVPASVRSVYVRVVTAEGRAMNHFNKKSKGLLVRALADAHPRIGSPQALLSWARDRGLQLRETADARLWEFVVPE